jgi:hypothetical protein
MIIRPLAKAMSVVILFCYLNIHAQKLNPDAEYLPKGFVGDSIIAVYAELIKSLGPKGEYESTQQYQARLAEAAKRHKDRLFAFRFKPVHLPGVNDNYAFYFTEYDADKQELIFDIPSRGNEVEMAATVRSSKYKASNRFGVSTFITKYEGHIYQIAVASGPDLTIKIKMPPAQARGVRDRLSVLFLCSLNTDKDASKIITDFEGLGLTPTMDHPYEDLTETHQLSVKVKSIWVYDRITMRVLAKANQ